MFVIYKFDLLCVVLSYMQNRLCSLMNIYRWHYWQMYSTIVVVVLKPTDPAIVGNYQRINPLEIEVIIDG